jgi:hypothetical protein
MTCNIVTGEMTGELLFYGVDIVKMRISPESLCITCKKMDCQSTIVIDY